MKSKYKLIVILGTGLAMTMVSGLAMAASSDLKGLVSNIQENVKPIANFLVILSYISGIAFALNGILQFKAYKDNPQQTPLSKPLLYIGIGALLLFLPSIINSAGTTIFKSTDNNAQSGELKFD
jgi:hypothetical protein